MILEADNMWLEYGGRTILQNIYLKIEKGQVVGLLGRNGTGKTSLLRMIFGSLRGQNQSVRINQDYISHPFSQKRLIRYLPQDSFTPNMGIQKICDLYDVDFKRICQYFTQFEDYPGQNMKDLSGGNRRLFETLLILLSPVSFVLLDEPFTNLAPIIQQQLKGIIKQEKENKGILISDHFYRDVLEVSDQVYLLLEGGSSVLLKDREADLKKFGYIR